MIKETKFTLDVKVNGKSAEYFTQNGKNTFQIPISAPFVIELKALKEGKFKLNDKVYNLAKDALEPINETFSAIQHMKEYKLTVDDVEHVFVVEEANVENMFFFDTFAYF